MPGPLNLNAVRLLDRGLKIPGNNQLPRVRGSNSIVEDAVIATCAESAPSRLYLGTRRGYAANAILKLLSISLSALADRIVRQALMRPIAR
jgi:hypothetical protein